MYTSEMDKVNISVSNKANGYLWKGTQEGILEGFNVLSLHLDNSYTGGSNVSQSIKLCICDFCTFVHIYTHILYITYVNIHIYTLQIKNYF